MIFLNGRNLLTPLWVFSIQLDLNFFHPFLSSIFAWKAVFTGLSIHLRLHDSGLISDRLSLQLPLCSLQQ